VAIADVRVPRARLLVGAATAVVCAALLWLARANTFYFDEWSFILGAPDWSLASYLQPHNEHPAILHQLVYALLLHTVGLRSYVPYMAVLLALHGANVLLLFEVVRRRAGDLAGIAAAALLLVLGAGWDDILWAFQMAWLASLALGLGVLLALDGPSTPRRLALAAALLLGSLMFSGVGLPFAVAAGAYLLLAPGRRGQLLWLAPAAIALAAWYVAFGRFGAHPNPPPSAGNVLLLPGYVLWGLAQSAAALIGEGGWVGVPILALAALAVAWAWWRGRPDAFAMSVAAALLAFFAVAGLTRAQLGYEQAASSRYLYIGAALWMILLSDAARRLPWRGTWRPALAACVFLACFNSGALLFSFAAARTVLMERQVADLYALSSERADPCLDPNGAVDRLVMPVETQPSLYFRAVDLFGDPASGMPLQDRASYAAGVRNLRRASC
jgi:hypothetical protein